MKPDRTTPQIKAKTKAMLNIEEDKEIRAELFSIIVEDYELDIHRKWKEFKSKRDVQI